ncbi:MAG: cysteine synthase A [Lachnospiraceae bacterium]|nr:cysteine synthase A [Lachnospiraceae bacterium]
MKKVYQSIEQLIGNTPLLELTHVEQRYKLQAVLLGKLEYLNPAGSVKDRVAKAMIEEAERSGKLQKGSIIVEPTSGNTGIGLAMIAAAKGYRLQIVMPENMSKERQLLMKAYGAEVILTEASKGMAGAIEKAKHLVEAEPKAIMAGQFINPANPNAHMMTTGPEIWEDTEGAIDILIAGIGTGGSITGTGKYLKMKCPNIKVIGVEPAASPVLSKGESGPHGLQGIGAGFVPEVLDTAIYDEVIAVKEEDAYQIARQMGKEEGVLVGISSGAALWAAIEVAKRSENAGKTIVVLLPDSGERYLSTALFQ